MYLCAAIGLYGTIQTTLVYIVDLFTKQGAQILLILFLGLMGGVSKRVAHAGCLAYQHLATLGPDLHSLGVA